MCAILLEVAIMPEFGKVIIGSASEDSTSEPLVEKPKLFDLNSDPLENEVSQDENPIVFKTKTYHVGSGNIIGKNIFKNSLIARE